MCIYFQTKIADVALTTWHSSASNNTVLFSVPSPLVVPTQDRRKEMTTPLYISVGVSAVIVGIIAAFSFGIFMIACVKKRKNSKGQRNIPKNEIDLSLQAVCAATTDLNTTTDVANHVYDYVFSTGTILTVSPQKASGEVPVSHNPAYGVMNH